MKKTISYSAITICIAMIALTLSEGSYTVLSISNSLFLASVSIGSLGFIFALISTSRRHYYQHLKASFSGENPKELQYDKKVELRQASAATGATIGICGIAGICTSAILTFF